METILNTQFEQLQKAIEGIMEAKTKVSVLLAAQDPAHSVFYRGSQPTRHAPQPH